MQVQRRQVSTLTFDPSNARKHGDRNLEAIKSSLAKFGQQKPIVVDSAGVVVAGNGTLAAAKALGWAEIDVVVTDLAGSQATAFAIADNRTSELAEWDGEVLTKLLGSLELDERIAAGFDDAELAKLENSLKAEAAVQVVEDEIPDAPTEPVTKPGDLIVLGRHRVLCGDSTKAEDIARLMGGEVADLCFTSPPYGQQRNYTEEGKAHVSDWEGLMRGAFGNLPMSPSGQVLVNLGPIHVDGEWWPYWDPWIDWMRKNGWKRYGWYVWDKLTALPGDWVGRLAARHEFVFHFNKQTVQAIKCVPCKTAGMVGIDGKNAGVARRDGSKSVFRPKQTPRNDYRVRDSVCTVRNAIRQLEGTYHPAVMPVALADHFISSWPGDVFEPFCGSGTTLVAAEQIGRRCFGMEISPKYCDIIVARWEKLTGEKAQRQHQ